MLLPLDQRRICLSAVEQFSSDYAEIAADNCNIDPSDIWKKSDAAEKINWFAQCFKKKLDLYLDREEEVRIAAKLDVISNEVISQLDDTQLKSDLFSKISGIFKEMFKQILFENPLTIKQPDHSLSREDFQIAEMSNYEEYKSNKRISLCYDFAFYQLNEEKAFPYIFNSEAYQWPADFYNDSINYLAGWGYEEVKEPSPGDLVLYRYEDNTKHAGIWAEGSVLSKLGMSDVVKHPIADVCLGYGDDVYFLRKRIKSPLLNNFINELDKVQHSLPNCLLSETDSSLNTPDCVKKIIEIFESMEIKNVFKNSIYNIDYNNDLRRETLLRLNEYYVTISDSTQKTEAIKTIKEIVLSVSDQLTRKI